MNTFFSKKLFSAALVVGTLDISAACIHFYVKTGNGPAPLLKYVASGFFGKDAFADGWQMVFFGLLFHYFNAFSFTVCFFFIAKKFPIILKQKILTGIIYGAFAWIIMNLIVLPISNVHRNPFNLTNAIIGMTILIICIGIPLSFLASNKDSND